MEAGKLRHRVDLMQNGVADRDSGGHRPKDTTPTKLATLWAAVDGEKFPGDEPTDANQQRPRAKYSVLLRYRAGVTTAMWLVWEGRRLNIESANSDPRKTQLTLVCREAA